MSVNTWRLEESLLNSRVVMKGDYPYIITPICDGVPCIYAGLLREVTSALQVEMYDSLENADRIVTIEAMGIPIATALSLEADVPMTIVRKRRYHLPGEYVVTTRTGYSEATLYVNGLEKGDKVVIVDDVLSTGNTMSGLIDVLRLIGVEILDIGVVVNKSHDPRCTKIDGHNIKSLAYIEVVDGKVQLRKEATQ